MQDVLWWERKYQKNTGISLNALNEERRESWGQRESFDFSFCHLLHVPVTAMWAGPPSHTLYLSIHLYFTCPLTLTQVILSFDFLPFCPSAYTVCQTTPLFHLCSDYSPPTGESSSNSQWPGFWCPVLLCCSLALTAWKEATINNTGSGLCSTCFHKCPGSLGFTVLDGCGKRVGNISCSQCLILREAKDSYIYADQNRFPKHLPAPFEQSAHNCSCCTGDSASKSWVEYEIWFIFVVGQLPVFPLGWSCVNPALIFSELMWEMLCPHLYIVDFFSRQLIPILFRSKIYIRKELISKEHVLVFLIST